MDAHGIPEDAQDMGKVVRAVVAIGSMRNQRRGKRFVWGESFSREHSATCHEEDRFPPIGIGAEWNAGGKRMRQRRSQESQPIL
jgi:hypothetical protein